MGQFDGLLNLKFILKFYYNIEYSGNNIIHDHIIIGL